jgi:hypothetical protein
MKKHKIVMRTNPRENAPNSIFLNLDYSFGRIGRNKIDIGSSFSISNNYLLKLEFLKYYLGEKLRESIRNSDL